MLSLLLHTRKEQTGVTCVLPMSNGATPRHDAFACMHDINLRQKQRQTAILACSQSEKDDQPGLQMWPDGLSCA